MTNRADLLAAANRLSPGRYQIDDIRTAIRLLRECADAIPEPDSGVTITDEMVERGAEQLCLNHVSSGAIPWDDLGEAGRDVYRHDVRSVLEAAQPVAETENGSTA